MHTSFDDSMADIIERFREKDVEDQQQDAEKRGKADEERGSRNAKILNGDFCPEQKEEG